MAVSRDEFPANLSGRTVLLRSLLTVSQEISSLEPMRILLRKSSAFVIGEARLFSILFEELVQDPPVNAFPHSVVLCFEEMHMVLRRIKVLLQDCSACSRMLLLMQVPSISNSFHRLIAELSTLLDIFPANEIGMSEDLVELLNLISKQCCNFTSVESVDPRDSELRTDVLKMLDDIKRKIVPDQAKLSEIFDELNLIDSGSCTAEILNLEGEFQNQQDKVIALIGLVRYAKCVLYGTSTSGNDAAPPPQRQRSISEVDVPSDFRCPISLDLMRDPVVVSTGQTYDRSSISTWIQSGHATCPKTGQKLAHTQLIPNLKFKNLIAAWCRDQGIPFDTADLTVKQNGILQNTAALEVTKMTAAFLVSNLAVVQSEESAQRLVCELRAMSKTDSDSRACIIDAGALPPLVKFLASRNPSLQINAVTTILNISIPEPNKRRILETDGVLNGVIEVLTSGSTWEAKGNAAAAIFSLTAVHACRKKLGKKKRVITALLDLARLGPTNSKRDAMMAILNLTGDRESAPKLIEAGMVDLIGEQLFESHPEEAVEILEAIVKRGGLPAICAIYEVGMVKKLASVMRDGTDRARECAAATLVNMCRKGGSEMAAELAAVEGIERVAWEIMSTGTERSKRKASTLFRILRRWSTAVPSPAPADNFIRQSTNTSRHVMTSPGIPLPA